MSFKIFRITVDHFFAFGVLQRVTFLVSFLRGSLLDLCPTPFALSNLYQILAIL